MGLVGIGNFVGAQTTVERVVALFHPRLVLGVSDEVPQAAPGAEAIDRLRMISDWCRA